VIVYLDASALVKRYVGEAWSGEVDQLIARASGVGTALISRAEVAAALAKAARLGALTREQTALALHVFRTEWVDLVRLQVTESLVARADVQAWERGLRGHDAVHLAAALVWQEMLGEPVTLATFDRRLWQAAGVAGLTAWPDELSSV
jgi:uncharacterized protein